MPDLRTLLDNAEPEDLLNALSFLKRCEIAQIHPFDAIYAHRETRSFPCAALDSLERRYQDEALEMLIFRVMLAF